MYKTKNTFIIIIITGKNDANQEQTNTREYCLSCSARVHEYTHSSIQFLYYTCLTIIILLLLYHKTIVETM